VIDQTGFALLGERKIVTIMFADIQGSVALTSGMDPERVDEVLTATIGKMVQAVDRYNGTVNRVSGDGIMAIFGAPLAHEHHAEQACHAALAILEGAQSEAADGIEAVRIRVGLHSGEVVVRDLITNSTPYYEAMGLVVSIAARMEQAAKAGQAIISPQTRRLAGEAVEVRSLGLQEVKGIAQRMELFELQAVAGQHAHRLEWDAASHFVGRTSELATLARALHAARTGTGGAVAVSGEAGSGKSRLIQEFLRQSRPLEPVVVTGQAQSFGQRGYQMIIGMVEGWLGIAAADSTETLRQKVRSGTAAAMGSAASDQQQAATIQALTALCDNTASESAWQALDPSERRNRIAAAVFTLFQHVSEKTPIVLVAEDLHWADSDSLHVLSEFTKAARAQRMLLVMTYRDDSPPIDLAALGVSSCSLGPLNQLEASELLKSHLVAGPHTRSLEKRLIAHTGGNPLFIEECLISLSETGYLQREGSRFRPIRHVTAIELPVTLRALISTRVDRLPPVEKEILQAASVIGQQVPQDILASIVQHDAASLDQALRGLAAGQFLILRTPEPDVEYEFRHALKREAVYQSILLRQRRKMHGNVVAAIERLHRHRIGEYSESLAEHAQRAEDWSRAVSYLRQSANKATARNSNRAAVNFLSKALGAAEALPDGPTKTPALVDILLQHRYPLFKLGELAQVSRILARAADLVRALDDPARLSLLHAYRSHILWVGGESLLALQEARASAEAARRIPDEGLVVRARFQEGMVLAYRGEYSAGIAALSEMLKHIMSGFGAGAYPDASMATTAQSYLARAHAEIGDFERSRHYVDAALELADKIENAFNQAFAALSAGFLHLSLGDAQAAIEWLERAREKAIESETQYLVPLPSGFLGMAYVTAGQADRAIAVLEDVIRQADAIGFRAGQPYRLAALGRAYLANGRPDDAFLAATEALAMARMHGEIFGEATALCVLAETAQASSAEKSPEAREYLSRALELARTHGLAPLERQCARALG
jgi:predicted ATPase/class 3 adenylate cyclase